jgi:hypothetical protein
MWPDEARNVVVGDADYRAGRALWDQDYTMSGIMAKTELSFALVRAAIRRA